MKKIKEQLRKAAPNFLILLYQQYLADKKPSSSYKIHKKFGNEGLKINLGAGTQRIQGFISIDLYGKPDIKMTIGKYKLPFNDGSVQMVYSSHFLEHISFEISKTLLRDVRRVMVGGGIVRISVPDMALFINKYQQKDEMFWNKDRYEGDTIGLQLSNVFIGNGEHLCMYDFESLYYLLDINGFKNIKKAPYDPLLDSRPEQSLFVTAIK